MQEANRMKKCLIIYKANAKLVEFNPRSVTSQDYRDMAEMFLKELNKDINIDHNISFVSLDEDYKVGNIYYDYRLTCGGGYFNLFILPSISEDEIKLAKLELYAKHDVASLTLTKIKKIY
ncbi:hypothetical protein ACOTWR_06820 [Aliarcobacter butzleri]